jgi:hypothetical protein
MAIDERTRHLRRLRSLRRSARGWSVWAGLFAGASAVLVPYQGLGLADAAWAAVAGGSTVLAAWRWLDLRTFSALPVPDPPSPELAAAQTRARLTNAVLRLPGGRTAIDELERYRGQLRFRGLTVAEQWRRLDRASLTLSGLKSRLGGSAAGALEEATEAERALRELAERAAGVERTIQVVPAGAATGLVAAHAELMSHLTNGISAYENMVAAAAGYVAADGQLTTPNHAVNRLTEAADLLRGIEQGLSELRHIG